MDYCSSCRRHLNGALVCPGCGAYAPDITPFADGRSGRVAATVGGAASGTTPSEFAASDTWHDGPLHDEAAIGAGPDSVPQTGPADDVDGVPRPSQGRAARRRQLARWRKNKRRAAVATAVALVGGGLSLAAMDRQSADRAQAATAPEDGSLGATEEQQTQPAHPLSAGPDAHRSSPTPQVRPTETNLPRQQTLSVVPSTTPPGIRPDAAASPRQTTPSAARPQTASPSAHATTATPTQTTPQQTSPPAHGTDSSGTQASPAPTTGSPSQVCVLVVCLG
ncbi:hypothetical protein ABT173_05335 [Streptomyces sp. NPDC001795]|uniref:SCO2400 family protein n=1 Tax=Streptomyces sp. NPDC001795 TaxID=3154525 RepID=UPI00331F8BFC